MNDRCCLCGGKIVNGKCVECGMPLQKASATLISEDHKVTERDAADVSFGDASTFDKGKKKGKGISNVRSEKAGEKKAPVYEAPVYEASSNAGKADRNTGKNPDGTGRPGKNHRSAGRSGRMQQNSGKGKFAKIISIFAIIVTVLSLAGEIFTEFSDEIGSGVSGVFDFLEDDTDYEYLEDEYDPYEYVTEELPEGNGNWSDTLEAGYYEVGVHLPAGCYTAQVESGYGSLRLVNHEIGLYVSESLDAETEDDESSITELTDLRCYPGTIVEITSQLRVTLQTDTAVEDELEVIDNPLTATYEFEGSDGDEEKYVLSGVDFPAGVYDLSSRDAYSSIEFDVTTEDTEWSEYYSTYDEKQKIRNITIPDGVKVRLEGSIILTPSEVLGPDWDDNFYDRVY